MIVHRISNKLKLIYYMKDKIIQMKTLQKRLALLVMVITVFAACNKTPNSPFTLTGTIEGAKDGIVEIMMIKDNLIHEDTAIMKDGKFVYTGDFPEAVNANLFYTDGNKEFLTAVYFENPSMTLKGNINDIKATVVKGGEVQSDYDMLRTKTDKLRKEFNEKYKIDEIRKKIDAASGDTKQDLKIKYYDLSNKLNAEYTAAFNEFIKNNPDKFYSVLLTKQQALGKEAKVIEDLLNRLDPKFNDTKIVKDLRAKIDKLNTTDISIENMIKAENVSYTLDKKFNGKNYKDVVYLGVFKNDNICALKKDGTVQILTPKGEFIKSFKTDLEGDPSVLAVGEDDKIYVLAGITEVSKRKFRGKEIEYNKLIGAICAVYSSKGELITTYKFRDAIFATGARVKGDDLIVADARQAKIVILNKANGELRSTIKGLRPCCGILDFSINDKNEVLVANLGAFRVQSYDFSGKQIVAFGQRGKAMDQFHGCCNPVSVAYLSNGAIVTVEKSPTRVKIYSKDGAKQIFGIEELVKGCSYIPMIVDSKDNLFLASPEKGMVKCISMNE